MGLIYNDSEIIWKVYYKWMTKRIDCTKHGIQNYCHGGCCYGRKYWPVCAKSKLDNGCHYLNMNGCSLRFENRPVVCHLYPLRLNHNRLVVSVHALATYCKKCNKKGPMIIDALEDNLRFLFGDAQFERVLSCVNNKSNSYFVPTDALLNKFNKENICERNNTLPICG